MPISSARRTCARPRTTSRSASRASATCWANTPLPRGPGPTLCGFTYATPVDVQFGVSFGLVSQQVCESCGTAGEFTAPAPGLPLKCPMCSGTSIPQGTLFGKYKLMAEIGRGSMGIVHDAQDTTLHRRVALKIMQPRRGEAPKDAVTDWQRFIQEARLTANVAKHAGIVTIYEAAVQ